MQSHANSLARMESDWTLRDGVNSLISNISCTKKSNLLRHFFRMKNCLSRSFGTIQCLSLYCLPIDDDWFLCSFTHWCKCLSVYPYITCIAQVTLKFVSYTLLVYNRWFFLLHFKFLFDLVANENRLNGCVSLLA